MISKQAQDFWTLLKTYPKQIQMPLSQAREADTHAEDFTSEPAGINFTPAPEVDGLWAEVSGADRTILYFFGGGFVLGSPDTRRKTAGHLALAAKARACSCRTIVSRPNTLFQRRSMIRCEPINGCSVTAVNHRRQ